MDIDTIPVPRQTNSTNTSTLQYVATRTISSRARKDWAETRRERASFPHLSLSFGRSAGSAGQRLRPAERPCVHACVCACMQIPFSSNCPMGHFPFGILVLAGRKHSRVLALGSKRFRSFFYTVRYIVCCTGSRTLHTMHIVLTCCKLAPSAPSRARHIRHLSSS